jgi:hypothetical protein
MSNQNHNFEKTDGAELGAHRSRPPVITADKAMIAYITHVPLTNVDLYLELDREIGPIQ